ncbi:tripartite tricarboxylate transporter TctB family protein [Rhodobacteraceae bacterium]|nr:tripartite tricarboxylate transporter TctB family protein [Paracoccaceae bacterium]
MLTPRVELTITGIFIVLIALGLYFTSRIDLAFSSDLETFSGPRAYPRLILLILLALILIPAVGQLRAVMRANDRGFGFEPFFDNRAVLSAALFAALLIFVLSFEPVGYILTVVPLLVVVAMLCGATSLTRALMVSIGLTALCLLIFRYGLSTVLPEGILGIDAAF